MAALNYAVQYSQALAQAFPYVLNFGDLYETPNNGRYKIVNANTIQIPVISTTGRKDANRDTIGSKARNYNNKWETKVLTNERQWDTLVHPMDIDQTNMVTSISNITQVYNETQKFPEMDAYTVSKIRELWSTAGGTADTTVLTVDNFLTQFDAWMKAMDEKLVPPNGRILYHTPEIEGIIKNIKALQRNYDIKDPNAAVLNRGIAVLDTVKLVKVPSILMKSAYDFTTGWAVGGSAKQINCMLIHPMAVITPVSYTFAQLDSPSAGSQGKYEYYEESFEDVFILNEKKDAIMFNMQA